MKKILLICSTLFAYGITLSQDMKTNCCDNDSLKQESNCFYPTITLDFKSRCWEDESLVQSLSRGGFYQVRISGINLNQWKVSLNNEDSALSKPLDLSQLFGFNTEAITSILSSINNSTSSAFYNSSIEALFTDSLPMDLTSDELIAFNQTNIEKRRLNINVSVSEVNTMMDDNYKKVSKLGTYCDTNCICCESIDALYNDFADKRKSLTELFDEIQKDKELFNMLLANDARAAEIKAGNLESKIKNINTNYDNLKKAVETALGLLSHENVRKMADELSKFIANSNSDYVSLPLQFTGDQTELSISITPHDSESRLSPYSTSLTFPTFKRNYLAIGAGMYFAPNMRNDAYSVVGNALGDSTFSLIAENPINGELGLSVLVRYGSRPFSYGTFGYHASIGTGLSFTNPIKPRVMLGGGISIGDRHRLAFDAGIITGYVDRLSNAFSLNQEYGTKPENVVVSQIQSDFFLSLGYIYTF